MALGIGIGGWGLGLGASGVGAWVATTADKLMVSHKACHELLLLLLWKGKQQLKRPQELAGGSWQEAGSTWPILVGICIMQQLLLSTTGHAAAQWHLLLGAEPAASQ